jgi:hypothetical protein
MKASTSSRPKTSIFSSETPWQKIDASRLKINGSDRVCKTLHDYVTWPFGQKDPRLVAQYYRRLAKGTKNTENRPEMSPKDQKVFPEALF